MPFCKVLPIRSPRGLSGKLAYIVNAGHRNHVDKDISDPTIYKTSNAAAFLAATVATVRGIKAVRAVRIAAAYELACRIIRHLEQNT